MNVSTVQMQGEEEDAVARRNKKRLILLEREQHLKEIVPSSLKPQ